MRNKIGVIGAGLVGATAAFALSQSGLASEIVLIDVDSRRAQGEALDIEHGAALAPPVLVRNGEYPDLVDAHLVIIAAGANQKSGETRLDLAQKNLAVIDSIVPRVARYAPECVLLVVSNPVDVLTWRAAELAGFAEGRVLGSGTVLDTARLRTLLSRHTRVDPRNVHAYVLGEHGDSEVPAWSLTSIAGMNMDEYCRDCKGCGGHLAERMREQFDEEVCGAAYTIIAGKGATYYGVAAAIRRIAEAILRDVAHKALWLLVARLHNRRAQRKDLRGVRAYLADAQNDALQQAGVLADGCERLIAKQARHVPQACVPVHYVHAFRLTFLFNPVVRIAQGILCKAAIFAGIIHGGLTRERVTHVAIVSHANGIPHQKNRFHAIFLRFFKSAQAAR